MDNFFKKYPRLAVAFSGGTDSAYLLYAAKQCGANVTAYYVRSAFQPQFELDDALRLAKELNIPLKVLEVDVLSSAIVAANPPDRCYHCKNLIFQSIIEAARADGYAYVADGTNASDDGGSRPGMRCLRELGVLSPLRECGLTKDMVRHLSRQAGLFTWDKPAYACLATRIPTGEEITVPKLQATERAENFLFSLGFRDFRVRRQGTAAKIQVSEDQLEKVLLQRQRISAELKKYYTDVLLDLETR